MKKRTKEMPKQKIQIITYEIAWKTMSGSDQSGLFYSLSFTEYYEIVLRLQRGCFTTIGRLKLSCALSFGFVVLLSP